MYTYNYQTLTSALTSQSKRFEKEMALYSGMVEYTIRGSTNKLATYNEFTRSMFLRPLDIKNVKY